MSKRKAPLPVKLLMLGVLIYAGATIIGLETQIADKREQLDSLTLRVQEYEAANNLLRQEMENGVSEEDISEIARTELSYAEPGERVFVDTSSR